MIAMADDSQEPTVVVNRNKTITQTETVEISTKRGEGTRDQDKVKKTVEREAELSVNDDTQLPNLFGDEELDATVDDVKGVMAQLRDFDPDADDE